MFTDREAAEFGRSLQGLIAKREASILDVAKEAVWNGFLMVGTKQSHSVHAPMPTPKDLQYQGLENDRHLRKTWPQIVRATGVAELAIADALWGNFNDRDERASLEVSITGEYTGDMGYRSWPVSLGRTSRHKNRIGASRVDRYQAKHNALQLSDNLDELLAKGDNPFARFHPREETAYKVYARPEFMSAATNPNNPLTGCIDFILDDVDTLADLSESHTRDGTSIWSPMPAQAGVWITAEEQKTIFTLPVVGDADMPPSFFS